MRYLICDMYAGSYDHGAHVDEQVNKFMTTAENGKYKALA